MSVKNAGLSGMEALMEGQSDEVASESPKLYEQSRGRGLAAEQ